MPAKSAAYAIAEKTCGTAGLFFCGNEDEHRGTWLRQGFPGFHHGLHIKHPNEIRVNTVLFCENGIYTNYKMNDIIQINEGRHA